MQNKLNMKSDILSYEILFSGKLISKICRELVHLHCDIHIAVRIYYIYYIRQRGTNNEVKVSFSLKNFHLLT